jgi:hypothetical protein
MHTGPREPTERGQRQNEIHEHAGTERDKQKNCKTTQFTISHGFRLKLVENEGAHKRFSIGQIESATLPSREGLLGLVDCRFRLAP